MKTMSLALALSMAFAAVSGSPAQEPEPGRKAETTPAPAPNTESQVSSQAETDAFNRLLGSVDPAEKKRMIEEFLKLYPDSGMAPLVHREASVLGMQENDFEMMSSHGEKALAAIPDDFALMTELARAYSERGMVEKAEERALMALELAAVAEKPPQATEEQWEQGKKILASTNYSTLGYTHVRRAQTIREPDKKRSEALKAVAPFKKAIELNPGDDVSYWRLGFAYIFLNDYASAESSLARATVLNGVSSGYARRDLEDIYKSQHQNSLEGLDGVLARAKQDLGLP